MLTNLSKEELLSQLNELMNEGQEIICINRHGCHDFKEFGFRQFVTFTLIEFDETVYATEKTANLFHDAYSFNTLSFMYKLINEEDYEILETVLYYK